MTIKIISTPQLKGAIYNDETCIFEGRPIVQMYTTDSYPIDDARMPRRITESIEGSIIRIFFADNQWFISTTRKLNAFQSRWGGKDSFGILLSQSLEHRYSTCLEFKEWIESSDVNSTHSILDKFLSLLQREQVYEFILECTKQTRRVCTPKSFPKLYLINENISLPLPSPKEYNFSSIRDAFTLVDNSDPFQFAGLFLDFGSEYIHLVSHEYKRWLKVRGNTPNLLIRYLELHRNDATESITDLRELCTEYRNEFEQYNRIISQICQELFDYYIDRYIRKTFVFVSPEYHLILKKCHQDYIDSIREQKEKQKISIQKVKKYLFEVLNAQQLHGIIERFIIKKTYPHWEIECSPFSGLSWDVSSSVQPV